LSLATAACAALLPSRCATASGIFYWKFSPPISLDTILGHMVAAAYCASTCFPPVTGRAANGLRYLPAMPGRQRGRL